VAAAEISHGAMTNPQTVDDDCPTISGKSLSDIVKQVPAAVTVDLSDGIENFQTVTLKTPSMSDNIYRAKVSEFLCQRETLHSQTGTPFVNVQTVLDRIDVLKLRKAAGHDGIQNENIIYGGPTIDVHLCLIFKAILRHSCVPTDF